MLAACLGPSPGPSAPLGSWELWEPLGDVACPASRASAGSAAASPSSEALSPQQQNDGQKIEKLSPTSVLLS